MNLTSRISATVHHIRLIWIKITEWLNWPIAVIDALGRCWYILAVQLIAVSLVYTPQGREAIYAAAEPSRDIQSFFLFCAIYTCATQATFFASVVLEQRRFPYRCSPVERYAAYYTPILIGVLTAFLIPCLTEIYAGRHSDILDERRNAMQGLGILLEFSPLFLVFIRHKMLQGSEKQQKVKDEQSSQVIGLGLLFLLFLVAFLFISSFLVSALVFALGIALIDRFTFRSAMFPEGSQLRNRVAFVYALIWLIIGLAIAAFPVPSASIIGSATILLLAINFWIAIGFIATILFRRIIPQGVAILISLLAAYLFVNGPYNQKEIRLLSQQENVSPARRIDVREHVRQWLEARREKISRTDKYPIFLVTADGGGIRAAYWTASTLSALQDTNSVFAKHVFGISGVSGGSLGAAVFTALLKDMGVAGLDRPASDSANHTEKLQSRASAVLANDFLAPPLLSTLISDVGRSIFRVELLPERAVALEQAFEFSWASATGTNTFTEPFGNLWTGEERRFVVPSLFLNVTEADTGRRLVMSNLDFSSIESEAGDLQAMLGSRSIRLSTAVLLSARFPVVSPVGTLVDARTGATVQMVDGGYFDNSGAVTAGEVLQVLQEEATGLGLRDRVHLVGLMITNEPVPLTAQEDTPNTSTQKNATQPSVSPASITLLAPISTLDQVRQGLTRQHKKEFREQIQAIGGEVIELPLQISRVEFPLGWMLSAVTRADIDQQINSFHMGSNKNFIRLLEILSTQ